MVEKKNRIFSLSLSTISIEKLDYFAIYNSNRIACNVLFHWNHSKHIAQVCSCLHTNPNQESLYNLHILCFFNIPVRVQCTLCMWMNCTLNIFQWTDCVWHISEWHWFFLSVSLSVCLIFGISFFLIRISLYDVRVCASDCNALICLAFVLCIFVL